MVAKVWAIADNRAQVDREAFPNGRRIPLVCVYQAGDNPWNSSCVNLSPRQARLVAKALYKAADMVENNVKGEIEVR